MSFILVHYNGCCAISCGPYRNNYTCINVYIHENKMVIILIIIIILYFWYCSVYKEVRMIKSQIIVKHHKTLKPYELALSLLYLKTSAKSYVLSELLYCFLDLWWWRISGSINYRYLNWHFPFSIYFVDIYFLFMFCLQFWSSLCCLLCWRNLAFVWNFG